MYRVWGTWRSEVLAAEEKRQAPMLPTSLQNREALTSTIQVNDLVCPFHAAIDRIDGPLGSGGLFST
jgi:hypothetical protein